MNITTKHLHALPFWDHLNHAEKDLLQNNAYIRSFDRDSYIIRSKAGEDIGLMMLVEGRIRAYLLSPDGREITLFSLHDQSICIFEHDRHGKTHIHLTHDYIARYIGTSRERVTKTLKKLNDKKLIHKSKGCIEITNIDGLRALALAPDFSGNLP